ncbi:mannose-binding protein C-like [Pseudochaenichthys georgianus]|uniref:mannose-binding protein C-like n=1 Tax=Pseudochaenichthys georgianus TaxID=52239 RepID=UPI00146B1B99|nr:pulmonary surfactant-associated protein D-like [Pseudochaenichthys georgianus]
MWPLFCVVCLLNFIGSNIINGQTACSCPEPGPPGIDGKHGLNGRAGLDGKHGLNGRAGLDALSGGPTGPRGPPGVSGRPGEPAAGPGPLGQKGNVGPTGDPGPGGGPGVCQDCDDFTTLTERFSKFVLAINYDFVRTVGQKLFVSYKERDFFSTAVEFCTQQGLELALPQNEEENNMLTQIYGDIYKEAWINVNNNKAKGNFQTDMKNRALTFTKWGNGQPDKSIQGTGCTRLTENGFWEVTTECTNNGYIICQL